MIRRLAFIGLVSILANLQGLAQEPALLPPVSTPPISAEITLTQGTQVSRPLQPVAIPEPVKKVEIESTLPQVEDAVVESNGGLPKSWSRYDLLLWFPKAQPLPPLLTASPISSLPFSAARRRPFYSAIAHSILRPVEEDDLPGAGRAVPIMMPGWKSRICLPEPARRR